MLSSESTAKSVSLAKNEAQVLKAARLKLARLHVRQGVSLRTVFQVACEVIAPAMGVQRIGIWLFLDHVRAIRCHYLYQVSSKSFFSGSVLHEKDFPGYFRALDNTRVISIAEVKTDPAASELRTAYLEPLSIDALIDAPIYRQGRVVGVICHECIGSAREWTEREQDFVASVADTIGRLLDEADRWKIETTLNLYQTRALELQRLEALGHLAAGIAHDFRNILTAINGYADVLAEPGFTPQELQALSRELSNASSKGASLIQELLSYGQSAPATPIILDLTALLTRNEKMLRMALGRGDIDLRLECPAHISRVFIDPNQLERAVLNLVINARDALPDGGRIVVSLSEHCIENPTENHEREGDYVVLQVKDNGVGMDEDVRRKLFQSFFTTKGKKGTGLGLAIVHQVVAHAGGFVDVESSPGNGAIFKLYLPKIAGAA